MYSTCQLCAINPSKFSVSSSSIWTEWDPGNTAGLQHGELQGLQKPMEGLCGAPHILQAGAAHPATEELLCSLLHPGLKIQILVRTRRHVSTCIKADRESCPDSQNLTHWRASHNTHTDKICGCLAFPSKILSSISGKRISVDMCMCLQTLIV